jgi:hypothetical protein
MKIHRADGLSGITLKEANEQLAEIRAKVERIESALAAAIRVGDMNGTALIEAMIKFRDLRETMRQAVDAIQQRRYADARTLLLRELATEDKPK